MDEKWLPVTGFEGYEVSDHGRVRSFLQRNNRGRVLKPARMKKGHLMVSLQTDDGSKMRPVHQLVLEAFVCPRPDGKLALHRDGNPGNNTVENLYWGTYSDNIKDSVEHGTHPQASKTHCKLGHVIDGVRLNVDGSFRQRYCKTCNNIKSRESKRKARAR